MRISTMAFYKNFNSNFEQNLSDLNKFNTQIASGKKLINIGDDSIAYTNLMKLNHESFKLEQTEKISANAKIDTYNTDTVLSDFTTALTSFKTDLLKAGNDTNSKESLQAIASNLKGLKNHLTTLANTSIAGKYIFSGTNSTVKPIDSEGDYRGNSGSIKAIVGNGTEVQYNIDGADLFTGRNDEYTKVVSTNIVQYNKTKLYPQMDPLISENVLERNELLSTKVYLTADDTIRDLIGDNDNDISNDKNAIFYIRGIKANEESFSTRISLSSDSKVDDLLKKIEDIYGNTSNNKVVDVRLNEVGQIEIEDLTQGRDRLKFNIFAAVDRSNDSIVNNANRSNISDLIGIKDVEIIAMTTSNVKALPEFSDIAGVEDTYKHNQINMKNDFGNNASRVSTVHSSLGNEVSSIVLSGKDSSGVVVNETLTISSSSTFQDLISKIESSFGAVTVEFSNGQLTLIDTSLPLDTKANKSNIEIKLSTFSGANKTNAFIGNGDINYDKNYFTKEGNNYTSNVAQIIKQSNEIAKDSTKISEVAGVIDINANGLNDEMDGRKLSLDVTDINGIRRKIEIEFGATGSNFKVDNDLDGVYESSYDILNDKAIATPAEDVTYRQLLDITAMALTGQFPQDGDISGDISSTEYSSAIEIASAAVDVFLDDKGRMSARDKISSESKINFSMYDVRVSQFISDDSGAILSFNSRDAITIKQSQVDIFHDLNDMIKAVEEGIKNPDSTSKYSLNIGLNNHISKIDQMIEHISKRHTKIGALSNELENSEDRARALQINIAQTKSEIEDIDLAEVLLNFQQTQLAYQAVLSTSAKVNGLSLLNYM